MYPVCMRCKLEMSVKENGVQLLVSDSNGNPEAIHASDVYYCRNCGHAVAIAVPVAYAYREAAAAEFARETGESKFRIFAYTQYHLFLMKKSKARVLPESKEFES